jgi:hypothetical protein
VAVVQGQDTRNAVPLGEGENRGVDQSDVAVGVGLDDLDAPLQIVGRERLEPELGRYDGPQHCQLDAHAEPARHEIVDLGEDRDWDDKSLTAFSHEAADRQVVVVISIDEGVEPTGVD